ncbi:hypothetical protein [Phaffia rhodozyma]|uniref:Cell wall beta-glucan synthesis n=1 Tax=Phaffia rhodozyma TaxID=264483 RepID=A0A0F7SM08_PHARH|nr:hypothetical protein [Phaffia rhodozyma]
MIALTLATALLAGSQLASAIAVPTYPDSTAVVKIGDELTTLWTADTTGEWTDMTIQMVALTTVGTNIDATTSTNYTFTIPDVTPTSAIYFLQYTATNMNASDTQWTTRWAIAGTDGSTTTPEYSTQPSGDAIAWGLGALVNGTTSTTSNSTTSTSSSDVLATSSASASAAASTASKSASSMVSVAASSTASAASSATKSSSAAASSATSSISGASERVVGASLGAVLVGALVALVM